MPTPSKTKAMPKSVSGEHPGSSSKILLAQRKGDASEEQRSKLLAKAKYVSPRTLCDTYAPLARMVALFDKQGFEILFAMRKGEYTPSMKGVYKEFHKVKFMLSAELRSALDSVLHQWYKAFKRTQRVLFLLENGIFEELICAASANSSSASVQEDEALQVDCVYPNLPTTLW